MKFPLKRWPRLLLAAIHTRNPLAHRLVATLPRLKLDRPVFVVGLPRSGTSVFVRHFARHPHFAHWSEAPTVWDPHYRARDTDHRWTEAQATDAAIRRIDNNFAYYTKWKGKARFVNKHPRNSVRVPFLMAGWPDAHIICLQRDPRAVVWSLVCRTRAESWRSGYPLGQFARPPGWREIDARPDLVEKFSLASVAIHETMRDDIARSVPAGQLHSVRYEDFVKDCHGVLKGLWEGCGVEFKPRAVAEIPETLVNMNAKWSREMKPEDIATMEPIVEAMVNELRYDEDVHAKASG